MFVYLLAPVSQGHSGWLYSSAEGPTSSQNDPVYLAISFQIPIMLSSPAPAGPGVVRASQSVISPSILL